MSACGDWLSPSIHFSSNWHLGGRCGATHTYSSLFPYLLHFWKIWIGWSSGPTHLPYFEHKVHGCYSIRSSCSPASTDQIWTTKLVLHYQIYDEAPAKIGLAIKPPLIELWLLAAVHVWWFLNRTHKVLPIVFTIESGVVYWIWRSKTISFIHVSMCCLYFEPHQFIH